ncbi:MAG: DUF6165 family protein [Pseudomonadota bacterium]
MTAPILIEISAGELVDKITILEIKEARIEDRGQLVNIQTELETLRASRAAALPEDDRLDALIGALRTVNETLWQIEDDIRDRERLGDFGPGFITLARAVYRTNDERAALKREINSLCGSRLIEEKSYRSY